MSDRSARAGAVGPAGLATRAAEVRGDGDPRFDVQRLDCYQAALEFQVVSSTLLPSRGHSALRGQLERAGVSISLNIAEATGRVSPEDKAHFFSIARGSATECVAILDILVARSLVAQSKERRARGLLLRIVQMLTRLTLGPPRI